MQSFCSFLIPQVATFSHRYVLVWDVTLGKGIPDNASELMKPASKSGMEQFWKKHWVFVVLCIWLFKPWKGGTVTMLTPVEGHGITPAQPICAPTLTVLPPSSDTESWSRSPSPKQTCSVHRGQFHRSRTRAKPHSEKEQGDSPTQQWVKKAQIRMEASREKSSLLSHSVACQMEGQEQGQDSFSQDLLLPPSQSWSRSPSPSRRSRWSLRSLLGRDWDSENCRLVSWNDSQ